MSLAMYAAPFNNNDYMDKINNEDNAIARKRNVNNKTQKRLPKYTNSDRVNTVLQTIHNLPPQEDELADFNTLLPPPISAGVEQTKSKENNKNKNDNEDDMSSYLNPPNDIYNSANSAGTDNNSNYKSIYSDVNASSTPSFSNTTDYGRFIPDYSKMYGLGKTENFVSSVPKTQNDILLEKLNYMITLLEQQQDDRTNNVTEEVILYSFLGIFIIFIVDSFARVGKYVR